MDDNAEAAPVLQPLYRAERILKDLENRNTTGLAAMTFLLPWLLKRTQHQKLRRIPA